MKYSGQINYFRGTKNLFDNRYNRYFEELGHYIVDRNIPLKDLLLHRYSLSNVEEAFTLFEAGNAGKSTIIWE